MATRFSIANELKTRWAPSHLPNRRIERWPALLGYLRDLWLVGEETILETAFYEPVRKPNHDVLEKGT